MFLIRPALRLHVDNPPGALTFFPALFGMFGQIFKDLTPKLLFLGPKFDFL
jgi:hypothetical protein